MAGAKQYKKAPIMIANEVAEKLNNNPIFSKIEAVAPGFLNLVIAEDFLSDYLKEMCVSNKFGLEEAKIVKNIIIAYGGPNFSKP